MWEWPRVQGWWTRGDLPVIHADVRSLDWKEQPERLSGGAALTRRTVKWIPSKTKNVQFHAETLSNSLNLQDIFRCEDGNAACRSQTSCLFSADRKWEVNYDVSSSSSSGVTPTTHQLTNQPSNQPTNHPTLVQPLRSLNATPPAGRRDQTRRLFSSSSFAAGKEEGGLCEREWVWECTSVVSS